MRLSNPVQHEPGNSARGKPASPIKAMDYTGTSGLIKKAQLQKKDGRRVDH
jgi:hypothetical protein